ncbi:MAG: hypothetical protein V1719_00810 [Patescibacteria group bacterium]
MDNPRERIDIGTIIFSAADIATVCGILKDTNPLHTKDKPVVQFSMLLGAVAGLAYQWGLKQDWFKIAIITEYKATHGKKPARADCKYCCQANFDQPNGIVYFQVIDSEKEKDSPQYLILEGELYVRFR